MSVMSPMVSPKNIYIFGLMSIITSADARLLLESEILSEQDITNDLTNLYNCSMVSKTRSLQLRFAYSVHPLETFSSIFI